MHCVKLLSKNVTRIDVNSETNIGLWSMCVTGSESVCVCATEKVIKGGEKGVCLCKKKEKKKKGGDRVVYSGLPVK